MADRYFFDKRVIKKGLIKYSILFAIAFLVIWPLNAFVLVRYLDRGMGIFVSVVVALTIVLLGDYVYFLICKKFKEKHNKNDKK